MEKHDPSYCVCLMCTAIRVRTNAVLQEELEAIRIERANMTPQEVDRLYHGSWDYNDLLDAQDRNEDLTHCIPSENVSRETQSINHKSAL